MFHGLFVAAAIAMAAPSGAGDADVHAILASEASLCAAFESGDGATLRRLMDATFTLTSSRGEVSDFARNLAEVAAREPRYEVFRNHGQQVRVYGDAAVVLGITTVRGSAAGEPFAADFQYTDTWIRRAGVWKIVASHASRLAPQGSEVPGRPAVAPAADS
jgi:ketosteroid isomerase-like protein